MVSWTFRQIILPSSSKVKKSEESGVINLFFFDCLTPEKKSVRSFETSGTSHPATQHHIMEDLKSQEQEGEILRPRLN
jgi:hypothetical protein